MFLLYQIQFWLYYNIYNICFASVCIILQFVKQNVSKALHWAFQLRASGSRGRSGPAVAWRAGTATRLEPGSATTPRSSTVPGTTRRSRAAASGHVRTSRWVSVRPGGCPYVQADICPDIRMIVHRFSYGRSVDNGTPMWTVTFGLIAKQFQPIEWPCPSACLFVRQTSPFLLTFVFDFWNLLCNRALPSLAVSCCTITWTWLKKCQQIVKERTTIRRLSEIRATNT